MPKWTIRINCYDPTMDDTEALDIALHSLRYYRKQERTISSKGHEQSLVFPKRNVSSQCRQTKSGLSISIYPETGRYVMPDDCRLLEQAKEKHHA